LSSLSQSFSACSAEAGVDEGEEESGFEDGGSRVRPFWWNVFAWAAGIGSLGGGWEEGWGWG